MRWLKRGRWKAGITLTGLLLLLVLMIWVPVSVAGAYEGASGLAETVTATVQATPTIDATVTELNKEKLVQEVQQLKNQNTLNFFSWLRTNATILLSALFVVIGGLIGLFRWFGDRRDAQDKDLRAQAEERFKAAVAALGEKNEATQVGGAILLRSFLNPTDEKIYRQYYTQIFDLAVAYLRLPRTSNPPEDPDGIPHLPEDSNAPLPLTVLKQSLTVVFKEAFSRARDLKETPNSKEAREDLNARGIQLDGAYLWKADLKQARMPRTFLRSADLRDASLEYANLSNAKLTGADLRRAHLENAFLREADLSGANLTGAYLHNADLTAVDFTGAKLDGADLHEAKFDERDEGRDYSTEANPGDARSLKNTNLCGVKGLDKKQLTRCKDNGANIDKV